MSYAGNNTLKRGQSISWQQKTTPKNLRRGFVFSSWGKSKRPARGGALPMRVNGLITSPPSVPLSTKWRGGDRRSVDRKYVGQGVR